MYRLEEVRVVALDTCRVKALGVAKLGVDVDYHPAIAVPAVGGGDGSLLHEVQGELARELDEPIVTSFGDNEDVLDAGSYASATCSVSDRISEITHLAPCSFPARPEPSLRAAW
jgi:hypothetical protein